MTFEDRVKAVLEFGVSERQYARFAGIAYGHRVNRFFDRLVAQGYARAYACLHNRAQLYHVHHHALYRAIGQADSRYRRPVSGRLVIDRLMALDAMLTSPDLAWLGSEDERMAFFSLVAPTQPRARLPHVTTGTGPAARFRLFPEQLPIGVEKTGRVVFVYLATAPAVHLRGFARRHSDLLRALPGWTVRLLFPPSLRALSASFEDVVREELTRRVRRRALARPLPPLVDGRRHRVRGAVLDSDCRGACTRQRPHRIARFAALIRPSLAPGCRDVFAIQACRGGSRTARQPHASPEKSDTVQTT